MMDKVKAALVGRMITDVGLVNRAGIKCARLILSDMQTPLLVDLDDVMITVASKKPMDKALHSTLQSRIIKAG